MGPTDKFAPPSPAEVVRLIRDHPLAWLVSGSGEDFCATLLPLRPIADAQARVQMLLGHCARSNRHVELLKRDPRAAVLFLGPQGYVSPSWMSDRTQAPTWNYASAQFQVEVQFCDDAGLGEILRDLIDAMESGRARAWSAAEMGQRYRMLATRIIGFRARVLSSSAKFKLGQDERDDVFAEICRGLAAEDQEQLLDWMKRSNPGRSSL